MYGSAPRTRGTLDYEHYPVGTRRFSPADAGNTIQSDLVHHVAPVQPRGRGEHLGPNGVLIRISGSAPRTRGTRGNRGARAAHRRFSPADAGNTVSAPGWRRSSPVQPRGRGEHERTLTPEQMVAGSAPRTRGTLGGAGGVAIVQRFSPADAGNTSGLNSIMGWSSVQPRGRGEHTDDDLLSGLLRGSAPRTRGTRMPRSTSRWCSRFSPADAGNTPPRF